MPTRHVDWPRTWRIIASRYPPVDVLERLTQDPAVWEALIILEQMTNPSIRNEIGEIALVPPADRVTGQGASDVWTSFTHLNRNGSRFSVGTFGGYSPPPPASASPPLPKQSGPCGHAPSASAVSLEWR